VASGYSPRAIVTRSSALSTKKLAAPSYFRDFPHSTFRQQMENVIEDEGCSCQYHGFERGRLATSPDGCFAMMLVHETGPPEHPVRAVGRGEH